jgi:hypothetical protein
MNSLVRVNSFARTGNIFLETSLREYLGQSKIADPMTYKEDYHNIDILCSNSVSQLVILRNPVDCIVSNKIYRQNLMPSKEYTMLRSVLDWLEWHITFLKNIDTLYPLTFEQVTESTEKCLKIIKDQFYDDTFEVKDIGSLLSSLKTENDKKNNIFVTSKTSKDYLNILSSYCDIDKSLQSLVCDVYENLKSAVSLRQASLFWVI